MQRSFVHLLWGEKFWPCGYISHSIWPHKSCLSVYPKSELKIITVGGYNIKTKKQFCLTHTFPCYRVQNIQNDTFAMNICVSKTKKWVKNIKKKKKKYIPKFNKYIYILYMCVAYNFDIFIYLWNHHRHHRVRYCFALKSDNPPNSFSKKIFFTFASGM